MFAPAARQRPSRNMSQTPCVEMLEDRRLFAAGVFEPPIEGKPWEYSVAFGAHAPGEASPGDFKVEINWGDGTSTVTRDVEKIPGTRAFRAFATHTYRDAGPRRGETGVIVTNERAGRTWRQTQVFADVVDAPLHVNAFDILVDDSRKYDGVVATFESECKFDTADEFRARIYTDGRAFDGTVRGGGGQFVVSGQHEFRAARKFDLRVVVLDEDGSNKGDRGSADVAKKDASAIEKLQKQLVQQPWLQEWGQRLGLTVREIGNAVADAIKSFARGLTDPNAKPSRISLSNPDKYPFSRSFFDAGRMLQGIAKGGQDLYDLGKFIAENPKVLSPEYAQKLAEQAAQWAIQNAPNAWNILLQGFAGLEHVDPAGLAGRTVPGSVIGGMLFKGGSELLKKLPKPVLAGTAPLFSDGVASVFLAGRSAVTIFGLPEGMNPSWMLNAMKGLNSGAFATNCLNVAKLLDDRLAGKIAGDVSALPSGPQAISQLEQAFGRNFVNASKFGIESSLAKAGPGSRGIVYLRPPGMRWDGARLVWDPGHVMNVVYKQGQGIWYIDAQSGVAWAFNSRELRGALQQWSNHMKFLRTN